MKTYIDFSILMQVISHAENSPRKEICGILTGKRKTPDRWIQQRFKPVTNISESETIHYVPNPAELLKVLMTTTLLFDDAKQDLTGIFHNHTGSLPIPSSTDIFGMSLQNRELDPKNCGYEAIYFIYANAHKTLSAQYYDGKKFGFHKVETVITGVETHAIGGLTA